MQPMTELEVLVALGTVPREVAVVAEVSLRNSVIVGTGMAGTKCDAAVRKCIGRTLEKGENAAVGTNLSGVVVTSKSRTSVKGKKN